jgi:fatty acid desaturase
MALAVSKKEEYGDALRRYGTPSSAVPMSVECDTKPADTLKTPEVQHCVNALRALDNTTNWLYLAREYMFLGAVLGLALLFFQFRSEWGLSLAWTVPATLLAWILIGAGQHRLATLGHEAVHYMLFRNRLLNELVSDWFCMFPLLSSTQYYRPQHLGHHQFVNDPERDPDLTQLALSGHRFHFPMSPRRFLWECVLKQVLVPFRLIGYIFVRARYAAIGDGTGPYEVPGPRSRVLGVLEIGFLLALAGIMTALAHRGDPWLLAIVPAAIELALAAFYTALPERFFRRTLLKPIVPTRWMSLSRLTYLNLLFTGLAWLNYFTGAPWGIYFFVLWMVPLGTTFSLFMILRQIVQHENAGRDRFGNTRVFHVSAFLRFAVFPLGMDYHLPHHLFPMIPHYRLRKLHALLLTDETYRQSATVTDGYFFPMHLPHTQPTVVELLAREPAYLETSST